MRPPERTEISMTDSRNQTLELTSPPAQPFVSQVSSAKKYAESALPDTVLSSSEVTRQVVIGILESLLR